MRAIILAAGRGSRMGERTADIPKCLTPLLGQPLFSFQCEALRAANILTIGAVRGYRAELLSNHNVTYFDNPRWSESNMVVSLLCARDWLSSSPCLVSYSDIVYGESTAKALASAEGDVVITYNTEWLSLWSQRFTDPLSDAETLKLDPRGFVVEIGRRAESIAEIQGQYMGLLKFTPRGFSQIDRLVSALPSQERDKLDMTSLLQKLLESGVPIRGVPIRGQWLEVDSEQDLLLYERLIQAGELSSWPFH